MYFFILYGYSTSTVLFNNVGNVWTNVNSRFNAGFTVQCKIDRTVVEVPLEILLVCFHNFIICALSQELFHSFSPCNIFYILAFLFSLCSPMYMQSRPFVIYSLMQKSEPFETNKARTSVSSSVSLGEHCPLSGKYVSYGRKQYISLSFLEAGQELGFLQWTSKWR